MTWNTIFEKIGGTEVATLYIACACLSFLLLRTVLFLCVGGVLLLRAAKQRKHARIRAAKKLEYTLPDERNEYVRERLQTALRPMERESVGAPVRVRYAQNLLAQLKGSPLSPVERLDIEEMEKTLALYREEELWQGEELQSINEIFARLLKLSAKYDVAV